MGRTNIRQSKKRGGTDRAAAGILRGGVAKRDITTVAKGAAIHDPLYVRALVLDDGRTQVVIVTMDTTAIGGRKVSQRMLDDVGEEFLPALRSRIESELRIPGGNVLVNASHTHPPGRLLCSDREQVKRAFDAVREAARTMVPVQAGAGIGQEDRITVNRTLRLKGGGQWSIRHSIPSPPDEQVAGLGPMDPDIGVLRIDRLDGRPLAVVYNFACHPLFGNAQGQITANFPAFASRTIEQNLGDGAMALFLQAAGGDVIDIYFKDFDRPRNVEPLGVLLGQSTLKAWRAIQPKAALLRVVSETIQLPYRTDIPRQIESLKREQEALLDSLRFTTLNFKAFLPLYLKYSLHSDFPSSHAFMYHRDRTIGRPEHSAMDVVNRNLIDKYLQSLQAMEELSKIQDDLATLEKHRSIIRQAGEPTVAAEVQGIRIGDCVLIAFPAELLVEVGRNIKRSSPYPHTFIAGFSNGYLHYGPPAAYYGKGGYETTECLLAPEWQALFESKVRQIIQRL